MLQPPIVPHVPAVGEALAGLRCALPQEQHTPSGVWEPAVRHPQRGYFRRARTRKIDRLHEIPMHRIGNRIDELACQLGAADLTLRHGRAGLASRLPLHPPDRIRRQQILRHRIPEQLRKVRPPLPLLRRGKRSPVQLHPSTRQDPRRNLGGHLPDRQARLLEPAHRIQLPDVQGAALQLRKQRLTKPVRQPPAGRHEEAEKNRKVLRQRPPARASRLAPVGRVQLASQLQARHPFRWPMPDRQARHRIKRLTRPRRGDEARPEAVRLRRATERAGRLLPVDGPADDAGRRPGVRPSGRRPYLDVERLLHAATSPARIQSWSQSSRTSRRFPTWLWRGPSPHAHIL